MTLREIKEAVLTNRDLELSPITWFTELEIGDIIIMRSKNNNINVFQTKEVSKDHRCVTLVNETNVEYIYRDCDIIMFVLDIQKVKMEEIAQ